MGASSSRARSCHVNVTVWAGVVRGDFMERQARRGMALENDGISIRNRKTRAPLVGRMMQAGK